jgi:hypothetical protein
MSSPRDSAAYVAWRRHCREGHIGLKATDATKRKMSLAHTGLPGHSAWNKGRRNVYTLEQRKRISDGLKGKPSPMLGKHQTDEAKRKIGAANRGRKLSDEAKKKISEIKRTLTGPRSGNWKGGVTPLILTIRHSLRYQEWRSAVFARDDFRCVLCRKHGGNLEADHFPKTFASIFYTNHIASREAAMTCQEFWNLNNGRTLCERCHRERHRESKVELSKAA